MKNNLTLLKLGFISDLATDTGEPAIYKMDVDNINESKTLEGLFEVLKSQQNSSTEIFVRAISILTNNL